MTPYGIRANRSRSVYNRSKEWILDLLESLRRLATANDGFLPFPTTTVEKTWNWKNIASSIMSLILLITLIVLLVVNGSVVEVARFEDDWQTFYEKVIVPKVIIESKSRKSQGIVYTASGGDVTSLIASILTLRDQGCSLPVEVFSFYGELNSTQRRAINVLEDVTLRSIEDAKLPIPFPFTQDGLEQDVDDDRITESTTRKYFIKPAAILASRFDQVLYLDSDNFVTADPTFLFEALDEDRYNYTAVFWPDYWTTAPNQPLWKAMHLQYRREFEFESGQMLIDKTRSEAALNLAIYLNMYNVIDALGKPMTQPSKNMIYKYLHGDKDTFKFAWNATLTPYYFVPSYARPAGHGTNSSFCGHTMAQSIPPFLLSIDLIDELFPSTLSSFSQATSKKLAKLSTYNYPPLFLHFNAAKYAGKSWENLWPDLKEQGPWRILMQYRPEALKIIQEAQGWTSTYPGAFPFRTVMHDDLPLGTYCIGLGGGSKVIDIVNVTQILPNVNAQWIKHYSTAKTLQNI